MLNPNGIGGPHRLPAWGAAVVHDLVTTIKPDVVITSDTRACSTPATPSGVAGGQAEIGAGMAQYWTQLEAAGISVTPIKESPDLVEDVPTCVDQHPADLAQCDVPVSSGDPAGFTRHRRGEADERQGHRGQRELADLRAAGLCPGCRQRPRLSATAIT